VGVVRPRFADVLEGTGWLDQQWPFDPRSDDPRLGRRALVRRLRQARFDMALLLTNSLSTALVAWLGGARERIGYVRYGRGPLLSGKVYPRRFAGRIADLPMVQYYLTLAEAVGCGRQSPRLELATTEADERSADGVWRSLRLRADGRVVALNAGGAYGSAKRWPTDYFGRLARRIVERLKHDVLVLCGPKEGPMAREVVRRAGCGRVVSMAGQPMDLGTSKACIRRVRLMVSNDSGPRHLAAALGKPVVTLYGPMLPVWGENSTVRGIDLCADLACLGCHKRVCPLGHHRCMRDLTVDRVYGAVANLIEAEAPAVAA
jgi:heptosyltransferase-2